MASSVIDELKEKNMTDIFQLIDTKTIVFRGKKYTLPANKRWSVWEWFFKVPCYLKNGDIEINNKLPVPDPAGDGKLKLFHVKKSAFPSQGEFFTNIEGESCAGKGNFFLAMNWGVRYKKSLTIRVADIMEQINYKVQLTKGDSTLRIDEFITDQIILNRLVGNSGERTITETQMNGNPDGIRPPISYATFEKMILEQKDPSKWIMFEDENSFDLYLKPENFAKCNLLPHPNHPDHDMRYRQYIEFVFKGLYSTYEKLG